jgi:hypothetical protein
MNSEIQLYLTTWKQVAGGNTLNIRYDFITDRRQAGRQAGVRACWIACCLLRGQVVLPVPIADPAAYRGRVAECEHQI